MSQQNSSVAGGTKENPNVASGWKRDVGLLCSTIHRGGSLKRRANRLIWSEDGPAAVEYAVLLALIIIACLAAIQAVGTKAKATFTNVAASIGS